MRLHRDVREHYKIRKSVMGGARFDAYPGNPYSEHEFKMSRRYNRLSKQGKNLYYALWMGS